MKTPSLPLLAAALLTLPASAFAQSQTPPPITPAPVARAATTPAPVSSAAQELAKATFENREPALRLLESNAAQRTDIVATMNAGAAGYTGDALTAVHEAVRRINEAGAELETTITSARTASERTWADIHAELTRNYAAYTTAVREGLRTVPAQPSPNR
jgi:hypothetical protein